MFHQKNFHSAELLFSHFNESFDYFHAHDDVNSELGLKLIFDPDSGMFAVRERFFFIKDACLNWPIGLSYNNQSLFSSWRLLGFNQIFGSQKDDCRYIKYLCENGIFHDYYYDIDSKVYRYTHPEFGMCCLSYDSTQGIWKWYASKSNIEENFDDKGRLVLVSNGLCSAKIKYQEELNDIQVILSSGKVITFHQFGNGSCYAYFSDEKDRSIFNSYFDAHSKIRTTSFGNKTIRYYHNDRGITSIEDEGKVILSMEYDELKRLNRLSVPGSKSWFVLYKRHETVIQQLN